MIKPAWNGRSVVIRVYDDIGNVIETHEHKGDFKEPLVANWRTKIVQYFGARGSPI